MVIRLGQRSPTGQWRQRLIDADWSFWQPVSNYSNVTGDFSQLGTTRNSSSRVKEPYRLMPTFDPKTTNWTTFIQDFEDLVVEMGWHGQEISKLKLCFSWTVKEFFRALPLECQNNYQLLKKRFGAIFGTADEQQSSIWNYITFSRSLIRIYIHLSHKLWFWLVRLFQIMLPWLIWWLGRHFWKGVNIKPKLGWW